MDNEVPTTLGQRVRGNAAKEHQETGETALLSYQVDINSIRRHNTAKVLVGLSVCPSVL